MLRVIATRVAPIGKREVVSKLSRPLSMRVNSLEDEYIPSVKNKNPRLGANELGAKYKLPANHSRSKHSRRFLREIRIPGMAGPELHVNQMAESKKPPAWKGI
mmetsp:Transcript_51668/g.117654  ORF Transcript_51668/g.117654 Transcript_51668/m.117654 type:complete len:103 (+) Transcript_51668:234-542(+)